MSQQFQQPQQHYGGPVEQFAGTEPVQQPPQTGGGQMQTTQQPQLQQGQGQQGGIGLRLDDALTSEMRLALDDFADAVEICEWCAEQCIAEADPAMIECIRLCRDVADLGTTALKFLSRDSILTQDVVETFAIAAQECAQECGQHQHAHCQDCASVLTRAANAAWDLLDSFQQMGGQQAGGFQQQTPQPTQQTTQPTQGTTQPTQQTHQPTQQTTQPTRQTTQPTQGTGGQGIQQPPSQPQQF